MSNEERQYRVEWLEWSVYRGNNGSWNPRWQAPLTRTTAETTAANLRAVEGERGDVRGVVLLTRTVSPWVTVPLE
jgi:hypothetical protein